jgi:hypothetical protein
MKLNLAEMRKVTVSEPDFAALRNGAEATDGR